MGNYLFVPYNGKSPACIEINGHKLVILSSDKAEIESSLDRIGGTSLRRIRTGNTPEEQNARLSELSKVVHAGVVVASGNIGVEEVLKNLEQQLPWVN